jgi:hypothetical protein
MNYALTTEQSQVASKNFGPVHFHNSSSGAQASQDMMDGPNDDHNMLIQQISTEKNSIQEQSYDA